jgi:hypothetical protein
VPRFDERRRRERDGNRDGDESVCRGYTQPVI